MADFNAGSIEGSLGLDSTPFKAGLDVARQQALDFEHGKITPTLGLANAEFDAKKDVANVELDKLGHKKVTAKADLDISEALSKYAILKSVLDAGGLGSGITSFGLMTGKVFALGGAILGLLSIMGPLSGVLGGIGAVGIAAFGGIAISLALFGAALTQAMGVITAANKAGVTLTGWAGQAQHAFAGLTGAWHSLMDQVHPEVFQVLTVAFQTAAHVLPMLAPLLQTTARGVEQIVKAIAGLTHTAIFGEFLHQLQVFMGGFLSGAGPIIVSLLGAFMHIFVALAPLMAIVGHGIEDAAAKFNKFSDSLQHGGVAPFIDYVKHWLPIVFQLFGSVFSGVRNLLAGLTPLAGPAIKFLEALVTAIGNLHLAPLARGFGDLFNALRPILPVLGELVNTILGPLGHLLSGIANDAVRPLSKSLSENLHPALKALHDILHTVVQPLSEFAGSIANLANPTGVHLVGKLLEGLDAIVKELIGPFTRLAVALESVVDDGLNAIIPILPGLTAALKPLVGFLALAAGGLADILSHASVVDVLLGIAAAVWLGVKAFEAYQFAVKALAFVSGVFEAISFGWAGLTVAQDANTVSMVANRAGMIAWRVVQLASAAATGVLTAAQWLLNAALTANPITLIVIALVALAAGLIYAYKHSTVFRNIVNAAFTDVKKIAGDVLHWLVGVITTTVDFVKNHWQLLLAIMTGPIGLIVLFLKDHWSQIESGFSNMIDNVKNFVSTGISDVVGFFTSLPGKLLALDGQMLNAGKSLMHSIFSGLESAASAVGGFAANIAQAVWHELESVLNNILPHSLPIHVGPIHKTIPLFPYLAGGGVSSGPATVNIGDNPGGQEAVVPLDKYDLPSRGALAEIAGRAQATNDKMVSLLIQIAAHLSGQKPMDPDEFAAALAPVVGKMSQAQTRAMIQAARAAA